MTRAQISSTTISKRTIGVILKEVLVRNHLDSSKGPALEKFLSLCQGKKKLSIASGILSNVSTSFCQQSVCGLQVNSELREMQFVKNSLM